jgi:hypothetical protein
MKILIPLTIDDGSLTASTLSEPDTGETEWVSAASYTLGDTAIRTTTHRIYTCILTHTGRTALPEADPLYWEDTAPTNLWAPFDSYINTQAISDGQITYVLTPGFFDTVALYGLEGDTLTYSLLDAVGGTVINSGTVSLYEDAIGLYEYLFSPSRPKGKVIITGLTIAPEAELTLTITGAGDVAVGIINVGTYRPIVTSWGGSEYGAEVNPITYSRIKTDAYGTTTIQRGNAATGMNVSVVLPQSDANLALQSIQEVLDVPCSWVATDYAGYEGLNIFGLGSASLSYEGPNHCRVSINVKGLI